MSGPDGSGMTRRQFVNGVAVSLVGASFSARDSRAAGAPGALPSSTPVAADALTLAPPLRQGLRGNTLEAAKHIHEAAWGGRRDWGPVQEPDEEVYDLAIVGAGLSGLAAAHFYLKQKPDARILILDNHDDFGGHARRNEFELDGRTYLGVGGSVMIFHQDMNDAMEEIFEDLGIDVDAVSGSIDTGFNARHGLGHGFFFNRATHGVDRLVPGQIGFLVSGPVQPTPTAETIGQMPFSEKSRQELLALYEVNDDRTEASFFDEYGYLGTLSYEEFLTRHGGVTQSELLEWFRPMTSMAGVSTVSIPANEALLTGLPGLGATSFRLLRGERYLKLIKWAIDPEPAFPDGNASIARLLIRRLLPDAAGGGTSMQSIYAAPIDYGKLDLAGQRVRIRLESSAVDIRHDGAPEDAESVAVTYMNDGRASRVRAKHCILACYNGVIRHIWNEMPGEQVEALKQSCKLPMVSTNILLRNWRAVKNAGVSAVYCPGHFHSFFILSPPYENGAYRTSTDAASPIVATFLGVPLGRGSPDPRNRATTGRAEMLTMTFDDYEQDVRRIMNGAFGPHGFDFDRDVAAVTVNSWAHGYISQHRPLWDPPYEDGEYPHEIGRRTVGRVAIANSDAGDAPMMQEAYAQAKRAVSELIGSRR